MVFVGENPTKMDDSGGYPHDYGNLHITSNEMTIAITNCQHVCVCVCFSNKLVVDPNRRTSNVRQNPMVLDTGRRKKNCFSRGVSRKNITSVASLYLPDSGQHKGVRINRCDLAPPKNHIWNNIFWGFLSHRATPSHHPFLDEIFPKKNIKLLGYPHDYRNQLWTIYWSYIKHILPIINHILPIINHH